MFWGQNDTVKDFNHVIYSVNLSGLFFDESKWVQLTEVMYLLYEIRSEYFGAAIYKLQI